jgi:hypothetical protein
LSTSIAQLPGPNSPRGESAKFSSTAAVDIDVFYSVGPVRRGRGVVGVYIAALELATARIDRSVRGGGLKIENSEAERDFAGGGRRLIAHNKSGPLSPCFGGGSIFVFVDIDAECDKLSCIQ